mmetsp:Transcript_53724/g.106921  ORF Transcript_53724/g.106921 Transcript_53724/m.106921 type:complete len:212 (+) Transcript_53724:106-741(+)
MPSGKRCISFNKPTAKSSCSSTMPLSRCGESPSSLAMTSAPMVTSTSVPASLVVAVSLAKPAGRKQFPQSISQPRRMANLTMVWISVSERFCKNGKLRWRSSRAAAHACTGRQLASSLTNCLSPSQTSNDKFVSVCPWIVSGPSESNQPANHGGSSISKTTGCSPCMGGTILYRSGSRAQSGSNACAAASPPRFSRSRRCTELCIGLIRSR